MVRGEAWRRVGGYDVVRILVGALLVAAAGLKAYQLATEPVQGSGLFESRGFLVGVVELELLLGLWLFSGLAAWQAWLTALVCFGCFFVVSLSKGLSGEASCGCFGKWAVNPWYTATMDLAVVMSLLRWRPVAASGGEPRWTRAWPAVFGVWIPVGATIAVWTWSPPVQGVTEVGEVFAGGLVVAQPERWVGKRLPLLAYLEDGRALERGNWCVVLYHHDCPACREVLGRLGVIRPHTATGEHSRLALVEVPPYGDLPAGLLGNNAALRTRLTDSEDWFIQTPLLLVLREGRVDDVLAAERLETWIGSWSLSHR